MRMSSAKSRRACLRRRCPGAGPACGALLILAVSIGPGRPAGAGAPPDPSCDPAAVARTTTAAPPAIASVLQDSRAALQTVDPGVDTILIGDSLTRRWPMTLVQRTLPGRSVFNDGMESARTQTILWRLSAPKLRSLGPRRVVLLIGTNNLMAGDAPCAIVAGIQAIVATVDAMWNEPILRVIDILPVGEKGAFREAERQQVDNGVRDLLRRRGAGSIRNVDQAISCGGSATCANFLPDHIHLTPAGYDVLRSALD